MNTVENVKQSVQQLSDLLTQAAKLTGGSPHDGPLWYAKKALEWIDAAVLLSGFTIGKEAALLEDVPCEGGWAASAHNLRAGKVGLVEDLDFHPEKGTLVFFVPHDQTWIPTETYEKQGLTKGVPVPVHSPYGFWLRAKYLQGVSNA